MSHHALTNPVRRALLLTSLCAITACAQPSSDPRKATNMTPLSPRLQTVFEKTKTVCFGRFLIDVPATAQVAWGRTSVPLGVVVAKGAAPKLQQMVAKYEAELKSEERFPLTKKLNQYIETVDGLLKGQKTVVGYSGFSGSDLRIYSYFAMGADLVQLDARPVYNDKVGTITELNDMARRLRPRADNEVPTEPGMCVEHAFLSDHPTDGPSKYDLVQIGFRLQELSDVHLSIQTNPANPNAGDNSRLKYRMAQAEKANPLAYSKLKYLRRTDGRQIDQWTGIYEALTRTPDEGASLSHHDFVLDYPGVPGDELKPRADIRLSSGVKENQAGAIKPSITDDEALAIWERITSSIRVRPTSTSVPRKTSDSSPVAPAGSLKAATGELCPATGEWECIDHGQAQRRHIRIGQVMPQGVFAAPQNTWQKLRGEASTYVVHTVWTLLDPDASSRANT
ncbi:MAG: hypothetical protein JSR41_05355 [Proteobacteria bacterium]|nr:hypothetical protein [Pseudomonadota bacterium]